MTAPWPASFKWQEKEQGGTDCHMPGPELIWISEKYGIFGQSTYNHIEISWWMQIILGMNLTINNLTPWAEVEQKRESFKRKNKGYSLIVEPPRGRSGPSLRWRNHDLTLEKLSPSLLLVLLASLCRKVFESSDWDWCYWSMSLLDIIWWCAQSASRPRCSHLLVKVLHPSEKSSRSGGADGLKSSDVLK